jgi:hypothetical protein
MRNSTWAKVALSNSSITHIETGSKENSGSRLSMRAAMSSAVAELRPEQECAFEPGEPASQDDHS